jgi:hypothetical protein
MDTREIVIRRDIPPFAAVIHSKEKRRVLQRCKGSLQFKPSITADAWDSHFTISLASFPRLQNQRLHVLEVFPPDRWWPKSRTIVFGTLVMQSRLSWIAGASEAEIRERNSFEDSIFIRFGIGYNNPELCCLVEILREVSWEGSLVFKTRLSIYSNVGSMRPYLSLADAFLSGESRELVRGNCADRPLSELPYRLRRRNGRDAMAVLDFGSVEETKNDFAEYSVQRNISHLAGISV